MQRLGTEKPFTQSSFFTEELLHREFFTQSSEHLLHTETFTYRGVHLQKLENSMAGKRRHDLSESGPQLLTEEHVWLVELATPLKNDGVRQLGS